MSLAVMDKEGVVALYEAINHLESAQAVLGCVEALLSERPVGEPLVVDEFRAMGLSLIIGQVDELIRSGTIKLQNVTEADSLVA